MAISSRSKSSFSAASYMIFLVFIPCKLHFVGDSCKEEEEVRGRGHSVGKGTGTEHKPDREAQIR